MSWHGPYSHTCCERDQLQLWNGRAPFNLSNTAILLKGEISLHKNSMMKRLSRWGELSNCVLHISSALWHQICNVRTLNATMAPLWLIKATSVSLKTQFSNYPVSIIWLWIVCDYLVTPYSPYHSQVEIILALILSQRMTHLCVIYTWCR